MQGLIAGKYSPHTPSEVHNVAASLCEVSKERAPSRQPTKKNMQTPGHLVSTRVHPLCDCPSTLGCYSSALIHLGC